MSSDRFHSHSDDGLSPWNSDNDIESVASGPTVAPRSVSSGHSAAPQAAGPGPSAAPPPAGPAPRPCGRTRGPRRRRPAALDGPADDVVATLRLLVALEDYLGSLGPRVVDLLTEALKMEKVPYLFHIIPFIKVPYNIHCILCIWS